MGGNLVNRGGINYPDRAVQLRDFTHLRFGNITPTDLDAIIEYKNERWVIIEMKLESAPVPYGQCLALERLCDDLQKVKPAIMIIARHNTPASQPVDYAAARVDRYRFENKYFTTSLNVRELLEKFLK
jgi:hypothetical protein